MRLRIVVLARQGQTALQIATATGISRRPVQEWGRRYNAKGVDGLWGRPRSGQPTKLPRLQEQAFKQRLLQGPRQGADAGLCTPCGKDAQRIDRRRIRRPLLAGRRHRFTAPPGPVMSEASSTPSQERSRSDATMGSGRPLFVQDVKAQHPGRTIEVWFQDEARFGQQGTLTHVWAEKGSRPTATKQTEYEWVYLFAAVNPVTGESSALLAPTVNTDLMNAHLKMISQQVCGSGGGRHVVLVLNQAGWHVAKALKVPDNITLMHLPPYSPELNPIERLWLYLRNHYLSNRAFPDEDHLWNTCRTAWNRLETHRLKTICNTQWIERCN